MYHAFKSSLWLILVLKIVAFSELISLSGTVTDELGTPLNGAVVSLTRASLEAVTDSQGVYVLEGEAVTNVKPLTKYPYKVKYKSGLFTLNIPKFQFIVARLYNTKGDLVHTLANQNFNRGDHRIPFDLGTRGGFFLLVITGEQGSSVYKLISTVGDDFDFSSVGYSAPLLAKRVAKRVAELFL